MQHPKWFVLISFLGLVGVAIGWLTASEEMIPGHAPAPPEAAATPTAVTAVDRIPTQPDTLSTAAPAGDWIQTKPDALPVPVPEPYLTPARIETPEQAASPQPVPTPAAQSAGFQTASPSPDRASEPAPAQIEAPEQAASPQPVPGPTPTPQSAEPQVVTPALGSGFRPAAAPPRETSNSPTAVPEPEQAMQGPARKEPPYYQQPPVDARREQARRQREAMPGAYGAPHRYMPPWFAGHDDTVERYRDARRSHYRKQRDLRRQRRESRLDAMCPWPKPQREWSAQRNAQRQKERLERRAYQDSVMNRPPYGFGGPGGW